jgi:hydrophobic/amphiphilic exporter-1 (mainly G- bacteria), HAE1 family
MKFTLPGFAIHRPITVIMLSLTMLGLGGIAWYRLPLNFLPRAESPFVLCIFPYPGAGPAQVEQQIAIPVEGEFRTIPGLSRIETISGSNNCKVAMLFSLDTQMSTVTGEIRDRIERLKLELPAEVDRVVMQRFNVDSFPIMVIGMFSRGDREEFAHYVRTVAEPRLRRLEGVANIEVHSPTHPREVLVEFEQDTLNSLGIALPDILQKMRDGSMNLALGELNDATRRYYVRYEGEYESIEEIADLIVGPNSLRLRDVATVRFSAREDPMRVTLDGADGLVVLVTKESQANTVSTCEAVRKEIDALLEMPTFSGATALVLFDQSSFIVKALKNLLMQGVFGGAMAIAVLLLFMHRLLPTALVAFSIPTSLVFALVFMFFSGMSLNIITMVSMIIAVGMLVDNSIVVVENILRHRALGATIKDAVIKGANEVSLAIFASTVTTWVVFLPMFYMQTGQMSIFMEQLGGPLIFALGGSLIVALTIIPLIMSGLENMKRQDRAATVASDNNGLPHRIVEYVVNIYAALLSVCLRFRFAFLIVIAAAVVFTVQYPLQTVGMRALPKLDMREISIDIPLDPNYSMEEATRLFTQFETAIDSLREELSIKRLLTYHGKRGGAIQVYLYTEEDGEKGENPKYSTDDVLRILSEKLPMLVPGGFLNFFTADVGDPGAERGLSMMLRGDDTAVLEKYAGIVAEEMKKLESVRDIEVGISQTRQEVQVHIDAPLARQAGVSPLMIAQTVDAALRGVRMPYLKQEGREIPVWAQFREEDRQSAANLETIALPGLRGELTPLNQVTDFLKAPSPGSIRRINGKNVVVISTRTDMRNLMKVRQEMNALMQKIDLPPMYSYMFGDEFEELDENMVNFTFTLLMAVALIYLVMCALFESFILPFSIMTTVPLALIGAVWMLYLTGVPFDSISLIGCILMAGIIVNNGIVIVDHMRNLCMHAPDRNAAILQAGKDRFRPVLMTAITTILGLVPVAMAETGGAATFAGLGRSLIGGLITGTALTLFVVPVFFGLLDDFSCWSRSFIANITTRNR